MHDPGDKVQINNLWMKKPKEKSFKGKKQPWVLQKKNGKNCSLPDVSRRNCTNIIDLITQLLIWHQNSPWYRHCRNVDESASPLLTIPESWAGIGGRHGQVQSKEIFSLVWGKNGNRTGGNGSLSSSGSLLVLEGLDVWILSAAPPPVFTVNIYFCLMGVKTLSHITTWLFTAFFHNTQGINLPH